MVSYRRIRVPGGTYFVTVTLRDRRSDLLTENADLLRECFCSVRQQRPFAIDAVVVLPDHLHTLWTMPEGDSDYSGRRRGHARFRAGAGTGKHVASLRRCSLSEPTRLGVMQEISSDQVCFLIVKLRQFQAKEAPVIPDPGDNVTDDADREVLFDLPDDATEEEIRAFFAQLNEDEKVELLAMLWLGSGTYEDWSEAVAAARQDADSRRAETFLSIPLAANYLEDALSRFGFSCTDVDAEHL